MDLQVSKREEKINKLRRDNKIPAIVYGAGKDNEVIAIDLPEFEAILRKLGDGEILTTVFNLKSGSKATKAIIKSIQYHRTSYQIEHIDFQRLQADKPVRIRVPLRLKGVDDCKGVKLGGVIKQAMRAVKISCLPKDIPTEVFVDVSDVGLFENKKLESVEIPANVKLLLPSKEVVATVAKR